MEQGTVGQAADVGAVGGAECGEGFVPGGALVRGVAGGFGADRVGGVVVARQLAVGADRAGAPLPVEPVCRARRYRSEGGDGPGQCVLGGVLADPVLALVHQLADPRGVCPALRVRDLGDLLGPRPGRERDQAGVAVADPGVNHGGDVACAGQVPFGGGDAEHSGRVETGQFGGAQGRHSHFALWLA